MNGVLNDLRFGLRQLAARPGFAAAAILTLALGIGANTAVFSVLNGFLLKPLPYPGSSRLIDIHVSADKWHRDNIGMSKPLYMISQKWLKATSGTALYKPIAVDFQAQGRAVRLAGIEATASLFHVLRVQPLLGHVFVASNQEPGQDQVVVLSYQLWQQSFGGNPNVVGQTVRLGGRPYRVLGVMPQGFAFPDRTATFWRPTIMKPHPKVQFNFPGIYMLARLKPGSGIEAVRQELRQVAAFVKRKFPPPPGVQPVSFRAHAEPYHRLLVEDSHSRLLLLEGAVLLVLLITCVNVANLLLARVLGRTHEIAMRGALGATRPMLARQLLVEGLCLAVPGGIVGVGFGWASLALLKHSSLVGGHSIFTISPDWRVGIFALVVVALTGIVVSVLPIWHLTRTDLQTLLQSGGRTATGGRGARRARRLLAISEVALATALLAGSGLLLHSFVNVVGIDRGFDADNVLTAGLLISPNDHPGDEALANLYAEIVQRARALPGVRYAGIADSLPFAQQFWQSRVSIPGSAVSRIRRGEQVVVTHVGRSYFKALGIPIVKGRGFEPQDNTRSRVVGVIDTRLAKAWFNGRDPIGQKVHTSFDVDFTIVGVAQSVTSKRIGAKDPYKAIYLSARQFPSRTMHLVLKTTLPAGQLVPALKRAIHQVDPAAAVFDTQTIRQQLSDTLSGRRTVMLSLLTFGGIALVLAVVGVYGVLSYAVGQRVTECGVRLALGALPEDLLWLIIKDGLKLLGSGLVIGLGLAVIFGFVLSSRLFGIAPYDPVTLAGTVVVLAAITLIACYLPARQAAKLEPAIAMTEQ